MTAVTEPAPQSTAPPSLPPVSQLATASLALIVTGGVVMAAYVPRKPPLALPTALLVASALLTLTGVAMMARLRDFAFATFFLVVKWALLAYVVSAGMIEFAFVKNHTRGAPLVVVTLMLVMFAVDIPIIIGFTVARYARDSAHGGPHSA